jgi:hypothetical protein
MNVDQSDKIQIDRQVRDGAARTIFTAAIVASQTGRIHRANLTPRGDRRNERIVVLSLCRHAGSKAA